jgi:hypothetical protein
MAVKAWIIRLCLLLPPILLMVLAVPRFISGIALERAFPVPPYIVKNVILPRKSYATAAEILSHASPQDGETQILRAEAAHMAGQSDRIVRPIVENGLSTDPANARGWTLYSEVLRATDRKHSAKALGIALELAPYDYFLAGRRARDGAMIWDAMLPDDKPFLLRQAALLWSEPILHPEIFPLLNTPGGPALMTQALKDDPDQIRALNQWVARHRLGIGPQN